MNWNGDAILARIQAGANRGVAAWIGLVEQRAVQLITTGPRSGRTYRRRGVTHQASAPGEPPASDSGNLVNARRIDLITERYAARLTFTSVYAPHLQFGTRKMAPRPFADVALNDTLAEGRAALHGEIMAALR
jgi:hypothetical protein